MSRVEEIEQAIESLAPQEFSRLVQWMREREEKQWDEEMDRDSTSGALDFLFSEADREGRDGRLREWPRSE